MKWSEVVTVVFVREGCSTCKNLYLDTTGTTTTYIITLPRFLGLGDFVAYIIHLFTRIKPCVGCVRRKNWLNKVFPWHKAYWRLLPSWVLEDLTTPAVVEIPMHLLTTSELPIMIFDWKSLSINNPKPYHLVNGYAVKETYETNKAEDE